GGGAGGPRRHNGRSFAGEVTAEVDVRWPRRGALAEDQRRRDRRDAVLQPHNLLVDGMAELERLQLRDATEGGAGVEGAGDVAGPVAGGGDLTQRFRLLLFAAVGGPVGGGPGFPRPGVLFLQGEGLLPPFRSGPGGRCA